MKHSIRHLPVPRGTFKKARTLFAEHDKALKTYAEQLLWWNQRVNLVSRDVPRGTLLKHIEHSLLPEAMGVLDTGLPVVDSGTGGGLPGIPLAITRPDLSFTLNDIVSKKVLAVQQMARKLALENTGYFKYSIAELAAPSPFILVSKHAFKIPDLIELLEDKPWEKIILLKGIAFEDELQDDTPALRIQAYDLSGSGESFYRDKGLLVIEREEAPGY